MYLVVGHFVCSSEGRDRAVELMAEIVKIGRTEQGIKQYAFYASPESDCAFMLFEEWESKEAHDVHFESDAMAQLVPEFLGLMAEAPDVSYFDATLAGKL